MKQNIFIIIIYILIIGLGPLSCVKNDKKIIKKGWVTDFIDQFDFFNEKNWQDQLLWVNEEDQCYVRDGEFNTREVSNGSLKLRLISLDHERQCLDNVSKHCFFYVKV